MDFSAKQVTPAPLLSLKSAEVMDNCLTFGSLLHEAFASLPGPFDNHDFLHCNEVANRTVVHTMALVLQEKEDFTIIDGYTPPNTINITLY